MPRHSLSLLRHGAMALVLALTLPQLLDAATINAAACSATVAGSTWQLSTLKRRWMSKAADGSATVYFSLCSTLAAAPNPGKVTPPAACEALLKTASAVKVTKAGACTVIGDVSQLAFKSEDGSNVELELSHVGDDCHGIFRLSLDCAPGKGPGEPSRLVNEDMCVYRAMWPTAAGCVGGAPNPPGPFIPSGSKEHKPLTLLHKVLLLVFLYFGGGFAYNFFAKNERGLAAVPHIDFLRTAPELVSETVGRVTGGGGSYESIPTTAPVGQGQGYTGQ